MRAVGARSILCAWRDGWKMQAWTAQYADARIRAVLKGLSGL
jgi:hypothetical protein